MGKEPGLLPTNYDKFSLLWVNGVKDVLSGLSKSTTLYYNEAMWYVYVMRIVELVKVIFFIVSLLLLNRVVFQPLVKQILDEQIRAAAMFAFLPQDNISAGDNE